MASVGNNLEIDHIVPKSRSNDNGMNNKLLCFLDTNRNKGNQTIKEWLGVESNKLREIEQCLQHLKEGNLAEDYYTKKDYSRKWENLHCDAPSSEEFLNSQLTDTAYRIEQRWQREKTSHKALANKPAPRRDRTGLPINSFGSPCSPGYRRLGLEIAPSGWAQGN